jgi:hypothetical protein
MTLSVYIEDGEAYVDGRTPETARRLLAAAEALELPVDVVRTTQSGFIVPVEVEEYDADKVAARSQTKTAKTAAPAATPEPSEPSPAEVEETVAADTVPTEDWKHAQLDALAELRGVKFPAGINKAAKVTALTAAQAEKE